MSNQGALSSVFNPNKLIDRLFRKADDVVWDLMSGHTGIRTRDGIVTLEITETDDGSGVKEKVFQTLINPIDGMGMGVPAFAQQTALDSVKEGDLIITGQGNRGWVTKINKASVSIIRADGTHSTFTPPKTQILDFGTGVMVVRSLLNTLPNGQAGLGNISSMLMPLMMMGGGDGDIEKMLPMLLMMNGAGATSGAPDQANNPFGAMGGGGMAQMMQTMMMMKMMGGKGNMFSGFGADDADTDVYDTRRGPAFRK